MRSSSLRDSSTARSYSRNPAGCGEEQCDEGDGHAANPSAAKSHTAGQELTQPYSWC